MKVILDSKQIEQILRDLTKNIISDIPPDLDIALSITSVTDKGKISQ